MLTLQQAGINAFLTFSKKCSSAFNLISRINFYHPKFSNENSYQKGGRAQGIFVKGFGTSDGEEKVCVATSVRWNYWFVLASFFCDILNLDYTLGADSECTRRAFWILRRYFKSLHSKRLRGWCERVCTFVPLFRTGIILCWLSS